MLIKSQKAVIFLVIIFCQTMRVQKISERIRLIMDIKRISVKELVQRSGLKSATIYEWRRGDSTPRGDSLAKLASGLEVTTDFLVGLISYDGVSDRHIAVKESQAIYLRSRGIDPTHQDYRLYQQLANLQSAPTNVDGWENLSTEIIPTIKEHISQDDGLKRTQTKSDRRDREQEKTKRVLFALEPRTQSSKKRS